MPVHLILTLLLAAFGVGLLLSRWNRFAGTTLVAPYRWTVFSLAFLATIETWLALGDASEPTIQTLRYLSATSTLCPFMAVLGAKRPQNIGWQLIVATLWIVLVLPVGEALLLWHGGAMDEGAARQWMLLILLMMGLSNYLLTRFCFATLIATGGQSLLLLPYLPMMATTWKPSFTIGLGCIVCALTIAWGQTLVKTSGTGWNAVWCDFRNAFGLVWSLRLMERINSTGKSRGWKGELTWYGFHNLDEQRTTETEELNRAMRTALRRFVSPAWIETRHPESKPDPLDSNNADEA